MDEAKDQSNWTGGMMEVQVSLEYFLGFLLVSYFPSHKIKNIEASEAAKKGNPIPSDSTGQGYLTDIGNFLTHLFRNKREFKINEKDKEYKKAIKNLEQSFRKEGRSTKFFGINQKLIFIRICQ